MIEGSRAWVTGVKKEGGGARGKGNHPVCGVVNIGRNGRSWGSNCWISPGLVKGRPRILKNLSVEAGRRARNFCEGHLPAAARNRRQWLEIRPETHQLSRLSS